MDVSTVWNAGISWDFHGNCRTPCEIPAFRTVESSASSESQSGDSFWSAFCKSLVPFLILFHPSDGNLLAHQTLPHTISHLAFLGFALIRDSPGGNVPHESWVGVMRWFIYLSKSFRRFVFLYIYAEKNVYTNFWNEQGNVCSLFFHGCWFAGFAWSKSRFRRSLMPRK